jgi:hypothetical protein
MTDYERLFGIGVSMLLVGLFSLVLGLEIRKRKPIMILPKTLRRGVYLALSPMLIVSTFRLVTDSLNSDSVVTSLAVSALVILFLVVFCSLLVSLFTRSIWLLNVTDTILIEAMGEVLEKHGIKHSLDRTQSRIIRFYQLSHIVVVLPELTSSIKATFGFLGRAGIRFRGKRHIHNYDILVSDLRQVLKAKEYEGPTAAFPLFYLAILSPVAIVFWVLLVFLSP